MVVLARAGGLSKSMMSVRCLLEVRERLGVRNSERVVCWTSWSVYTARAVDGGGSGSRDVRQTFLEADGAKIKRHLLHQHVQNHDAVSVIRRIALSFASFYQVKI